MMEMKDLWYDIPEKFEISSIEKVFQLDYTTILMKKEHIGIFDKVKLPKRLRLVFEVSNTEEVSVIEKKASIKEKIDYLVSRNLNLAMELKNYGYKTGIIVNVVDRPTLDKVVELVPKYDVVIIEFADPTNIPLELILASNKSNSRIYKKVKTAKDGSVSMLTMEVGCNGIVLNSSDVQEITTLGQVLQKSIANKFDLKPAVVTEIINVGMGSRVCIDTVTKLTQDEGMLLGSTSAGGLLTCSETHFLPYMNLRAFRVNAGGIHLYVWGPENKVVYLSDLRSGDKVYVVNSKGEARIVTIGRLKIEMRPLLCIKCKIGETEINTFIQDDWHVRMFGSKGEIRPSSEIQLGDKLLGFLDVPGRHVGLKIDETIKEL